MTEEVPSTGTQHGRGDRGRGGWSGRGERGRGREHARRRSKSVSDAAVLDPPLHSPPQPADATHVGGSGGTPPYAGHAIPQPQDARLQHDGPPPPARQQHHQHAPHHPQHQQPQQQQEGGERRGGRRRRSSSGGGGGRGGVSAFDFSPETDDVDAHAHAHAHQHNDHHRHGGGRRGGRGRSGAYRGSPQPPHMGGRGPAHAHARNAHTSPVASPPSLEHELHPLESPVNFVDPVNPVLAKTRIPDNHPVHGADHLRGPYRRHSAGGGGQGGGRGRGGSGKERHSTGGGPRHDVQHHPDGQRRVSGGAERRDLTARRKRSIVFQDYMAEEEALKGVREGRLFKGSLRINARNWRAAYISPEGNPFGRDVLIDGTKDRNRALEGDVVVVELHDVTKWGSKREADDRRKSVEGGTVSTQVEKALEGLKIDGADDATDGNDAPLPVPLSTDVTDVETIDVVTENEPVDDDVGEVELSQEEAAAKAWATDEQQAALWRPRVDAVRSVDHLTAAAQPNGQRANAATSVLATEIRDMIARGGGLQPTGRVVAILERKHKTDLLGQLCPRTAVPDGEPLSVKDAFVDFIPFDSKCPQLLVPRLECPFQFLQRPSDFTRKMFVVRIKSMWKADSEKPLGENARCVGEAGVISTETDALLQAHDVDHGDFPPHILTHDPHLAPLLGLSPPPPPQQQQRHGRRRSASSGDVHGRSNSPSPPRTAASPVAIDPFSVTCDFKIPPGELASRRDFRSTRIFTIDPLTAKDLDDALHATDLGDGTVEIGVHIADVSYFVREGTALDKEALRRATTVYLVQRVVPMLPPILCEQLCSLNPNVDRLAYSVVWRMYKDGTMVDEEPWYGRSVIRSCAKLDYGTAQRLIDEDLRLDDNEFWDPKRRPIESSGHTCQDVQHDVRLLHSVGMARRRKRFGEGGALALQRTKLFFRLDTDGNPSGFCEYPIRESNNLVEEYMLLANYLVAQRLIEVLGDRSLIRHHPPPAAAACESLVNLCQHHRLTSYDVRLYDPSESIMHFCLYKALKSGGQSHQLGEYKLPIDMTHSGRLHAALRELEALGTDPALIRSLTALATHTMRPAEYICAAKHAPPHWRHYALNIPYYTHFTSPIRRYADVIVHRLLTATLRPPTVNTEDGASAAEVTVVNGQSSTGATTPPTVAAAAKGVEGNCGGGGAGEAQGLLCLLGEDEVSAVAKQCNEKKLAAKNAQAASDRLFLCVYLAEHPMEVEGVVIGIGEKSFTVFVSAIDLEDRMPVSSVANTVCKWDANDKVLTLTPHAETGNPAWGAYPLVIKVFTKLRVRCGCDRSRVPMRPNVEVLGPLVVGV